MAEGVKKRKVSEDELDQIIGGILLGDSNTTFRPDDKVIWKGHENLGTGFVLAAWDNSCMAVFGTNNVKVSETELQPA